MGRFSTPCGNSFRRSRFLALNSRRFVDPSSLSCGAQDSGLPPTVSEAVEPPQDSVEEPSTDPTTQSFSAPNPQNADQFPPDDSRAFTESRVTGSIARHLLGSFSTISSPCPLCASFAALCSNTRSSLSHQSVRRASFMSSSLFEEGASTIARVTLKSAREVLVNVDVAPQTTRMALVALLASPWATGPARKAGIRNLTVVISAPGGRATIVEP